MRKSISTAVLLVAVLAGCTGSALTKSSTNQAITSHLDHVVIGVPNLDTAVAEIETLTGIRPVLGGSHPGRGTHNALLSLGQGVYLELISAQPDAKATGSNADLMLLTSPTPIDWAVGILDARSSAASLHASGFTPSQPEPGSRKSPSGALLQWHTFGLDNGPEGAPFFIEWHPGTPHPSTTAPSGCSLLALRIASPDGAALERLLAKLGLNVIATSAQATQISVKLQCPRGVVILPYPA